MDKILRSANPSASTGPLIIMQRSSQVLEPTRLNSHIIVCEGDDSTLSLSDSRIPSIGKSLLCLKDIADSTWYFVAIRVHDRAGVVARIIVDDKYLLFGARRKLRCKYTLDCRAKEVSAIVFTKN